MSKLLLLAAIAAVLRQSEALLSKGSIIIPPSTPFFLSKFCFDFAEHGGPQLPGSIHMEFWDSSLKVGTYEVVVFDDQATSFPDESALNDWKCGSSKLQQAAKLKRIINASEPVWRTTITIDERIRPRWWYVAVLDCSGVQRQLEYSLHMTNPRLGWQKEFSMDQCTLTSLGFCLVVYVALALTQLKAVSQKSDMAQTRHPLRLLLLSASSLAAFGLLAFVLDAVRFTRYGESYVSLHLVGKFLKMCSKLAMMSMLLLLSRGVGITQQFRLQDLHVSTEIAPFLVACLVLETWGEYAQSRTYTTEFVYCTWVGAALGMVDLWLLAIYLKSLRCSCANSMDAAKQSFFWFWGHLYASAFVVVPFAALLSMILNPWVRSEVLFLLTNGVHAFLLSLLIIGLWPEKTQSAFCIDKDVLPKTIGTAAVLLSHIAADSSPCLLKTRTPKSIDTLKKESKYSFFLDTEESLP